MTDDELHDAMHYGLNEWQVKFLAFLVEGASEFDQPDIMPMIVNALASFIAVGFDPTEQEIEMLCATLASRILEASYVKEQGLDSLVRPVETPEA